MKEVKTILIDENLHKQLKFHCFKNGLMIRPFVEKLIAKALLDEIKEKGAEAPINKNV